MTTMMPSIALPTGPYDWHVEQVSRATYEARVASVRAIMADRGVTHAVVHGNILDHAALLWLTHFTPKLGPAYALVPPSGALRVLFSGGPGMQPSAQRLTWVEDVVALKGVEGDVEKWLAEMASGAGTRLGLVEAAAMLRGNWHAVRKAGGGTVIELDEAVDAARKLPAAHDKRWYEASQIVAKARGRLQALARPGADLRAAVIEMERAAYAVGAQDIRVRMSRRTDGPPTTLPDEPTPLTGPVEIALALRYEGLWVHSTIPLS